MTVGFFAGKYTDVSGIEWSGMVIFRDVFDMHNEILPVNLLHTITLALMIENRSRIGLPKHL